MTKPDAIDLFFHDRLAEKDQAKRKRSDPDYVPIEG